MPGGRLDLIAKVDATATIGMFGFPSVSFSLVSLRAGAIQGGFRGNAERRADQNACTQRFAWIFATKLSFTRGSRRMANKWILGSLALAAAWIALPSNLLQGEPPAWLDAEQDSAFPPLNNSGASSVTSSLTADPRSVAAEPANSAANDAGFAVPPPSTPAPMFPAGPSLAAAGDMIGFSRELAGGSQAITLISASRRWMAVYHVDQAGQIRLVSSRPLDADFSFQFNATAPLPEEIRRLQGG
jgi:hypothetical protein